MNFIITSRCLLASQFCIYRSTVEARILFIIVFFIEAPFHVYFVSCYFICVFHFASQTCSLWLYRYHVLEPFFGETTHEGIIFSSLAQDGSAIYLSHKSLEVFELLFGILFDNLSRVFEWTDVWQKFKKIYVFYSANSSICTTKWHTCTKPLHNIIFCWWKWKQFYIPFYIVHHVCAITVLHLGVGNIFA